MSLDQAFEKIISEREAALLKPAASQIGAAVKEYGYVDIVVFPSLDALLASAIAVSALYRNGVDFTISMAPIVPRQVSEPTLFLGYPAYIAQEIRASKPSALIGFGEKPQGLLHVAVTSSMDSSVAALTAAVFSELTVVGYNSIYGLIAGYWRKLDKGKKAEFVGIEAGIADMLKLENKIEESFNLRLFRWQELGTEEAISLTLEPFLPGLSGHLGNAIKFLESDPRIAPLIGKTLKEAPEQSVTVLGEKLYELLKKSSKGPRRPTELIGTTYYSFVFPLRDLREAQYVLARYAASRYAQQLSMIGIMEEPLAAAAYYMYMSSFEKMIESIEEVISKGTESLILNKLRLRVAEVDEHFHPIVERILQQLGHISEGEVFGAATGHGIIVLLEQLLYTYGYPWLEEAIEKKCIDYIEGSLFGAVQREKCK
ncbi:hypothetical protein PYJP_19840 [Pyrofollis japonicus]|uniref:hypothetical protein n=1 Tax=Pyrofollis japonicus TaxID=3060460 RepID=UPI00295AF10D|nr:hypothetical protein [Pyrofollis japonicus]BEP18632.1 hypothetical protein PYJP_19840 [Pyrofollis japonicus]